MTPFALVTWANEALVAYEPLFNRSVEEALAYAEGMISERVNPSRTDAIRPGVTYAMEVGRRDISQTPHFIPEILVGAWFIREVEGRSSIVWQSKIHDGPASH